MFSARRPLVVHAFAVGLMLLATHAIAQDKSPNPVHVAGVVVDAQTDVPIRRARLAIGESESRSIAFTDGSGAFSLDTIADAVLAITKAGYARESVRVAGQRRADGIVELRVAMKRGAAITGRIVDTAGVPVESSTVVVRGANERRTMMTDDLGEFRFGGLPEGVFQVGALRGVVGERPSKGIESALTTVADAATPVRIRPGDAINVGDVVVEAGLTTAVTASVSVAGSGVVTGSVHDVRGRPIRVKVDLERAGFHPFVAASDAEGRFRFENVPAGSYSVQVVQPGSAVKQVEIRERTTVANVDFVVQVGAAISGIVVDEYGEPVEGAAVRVLVLRRVADRLAALQTNGRVATTDDRGAYHAFGLAPGRYLVVADESPVDIRNPGRDPGIKGGYAPVLYPGTTNVRDAAPVVLDRGDATDINIAFRRERTMRVTGTVLDSGGRPVPGGVMLIVSQRSGAIQLEPRTSRPASDGTFSFESVPPGDYVLQAVAVSGGVRADLNTPLPISDLEFGRQYVTITDTDPQPVQLRTSAGATIHGHVRVDGDAAALPPSVNVYPIPTDFDASLVMGQGPIGLKKKDDGFFDVTGVTGSRRFTLLGPIDGWYLKEARVQGVDALDTPFDFGLKAAEFDGVEIVMSKSAATISGTVVNPAGKAPSNADVVLFSTDSSKWYARSQSLVHFPLSPDGTFRIANLPPGSYYLLALSDATNLMDSGDWADPATLDNLRRSATRVTVQEGEKRSVTLRLER